MFPSPLGASYFQIVIDVDCHREMHRFRPLSGHLISKSYSSPVKQGCHCFRPLSGHLISKLNSFLASKKIVLVSVPSRGILFPNCFSYTVYRRFDSWFPSPLGASYFQMEAKEMARKRMVTFPSPLGASYFQIRKSYFVINSFSCFRPLSGHLISNLCCVWCMVTSQLARKFPSPLGASYFQIHIKQASL